MSSTIEIGKYLDPPKEKRQGQIYLQDSNKDFEKVRQYIGKLPSGASDAYEVWINNGLALANNFGEQGRYLFHQFSEKSEKYNYNDCEKNMMSY